jgi:hypothetical protein
MLIFWDQKLVFLAVPKTGSTAIEMALESLASVAVQRPAPLKHLTASSYHTHMAPLLAQSGGTSFTTVALMREPLGWLRSWYRFRQRDDLDDPAHAVKGVSFEQFARDYMADTPPAYADIGSQSAYLADAQGAGQVDQIFRYEEIDHFVHFLEDRLDCAITLPRVNVPPKADVALSSATEAALRDHMARDFALYAALS